MVERMDKYNTWEKIKPRSIKDFNIQWLPPLHGEYAGALADNLSVSANMTAFSILVSLSVATQGRAVEIKQGWSEPTNLYGLLIADRGQKKSQVLRPITGAIYGVERRENSKRKEQISKDTAQLKMLTDKMTALEKQFKKSPDNKEIQEQIISLQLETDRFKPVKPLQIAFDDITTEALALKLSDNNGMGAVISSEGGVFDTIAGRYQHGVANLDLFLKGYTVEPVRVARVNKEQDICLDCPNLCILIAVQPHVLDICLNNEDFLNRGLVDRFLYCPIAEEDRKVTFDTPAVPASLSDGFKNSFEQLLSRRGDTKIISLSSGARELFAEHYEQIENSKYKEGGLVCPYMSKLAGKVARIAGVLSVAIGEEVITAETMDKAINISLWALDSAKYVLESVSQEQRQADYIISRLKHKGVKSCSGHDLLDWCRNKSLGLNTAKDFDSVKTFMTDNNYMRVVTGSGIEYDFNPYLFEVK